MTTYTFSLIAASLVFFIANAVAMAQPGTTAMPAIPDNLRVPEGNTFYQKASAAGTQNYVCMPGANGPAWKFLGPQATLFVTFPWFQGEVRQQVGTHFLSMNPTEGGTPRPTWQHSLDTSSVWGKAIATSADPAFVAQGAIPWLLLEAAGTQRGPSGGSQFVVTTFIQRLNTSGGVAPASGCDAATYGALALVPYTADYYFYMADTRR